MLLGKAYISRKFKKKSNEFVYEEGYRRHCPLPVFTQVLCSTFELMAFDCHTIKQYRFTYLLTYLHLCGFKIRNSG